MYLQTPKSDINRTRKHLGSLKHDFKEQDEAKEVNNKVGKRKKVMSACCRIFFHRASFCTYKKCMT